MKPAIAYCACRQTYRADPIPSNPGNCRVVFETAFIVKTAKGAEEALQMAKRRGLSAPAIVPLVEPPKSAVKAIADELLRKAARP